MHGRGEASMERLRQRAKYQKGRRATFMNQGPFLSLPFISRFWFCSLKGWWVHARPTTINSNGSRATDGKSHASIYQRKSQMALCCSPQMCLDSLTPCASFLLQSVCFFFDEPLLCFKIPLSALKAERGIKINALHRLVTDVINHVRKE